MKKLFTFLLLGFGTLCCFAQVDSTSADTAWSTGGITGLNFTQTSLSNWAGGGENSISGTAYASLYANYAKGHTTWDNSLDLAYGVLKQGSEDFAKNDDRIQFISKFGQYAFRKHWYYSGLIDFKTQFAPGYNLPNDSTKISNFLAPAYLVAAIGMDYKPSKNLAVLIAPITGKMTIVNDQTLADAGSFGVEAAVLDEDGNITTSGKLTRYEFGGFVKVMFKKTLKKDITFQSNLDLFSNYIESPENIDVNWETLLAMKVTKYISVSLSTHLIYDDDIDILVNEETGKVGPRLQFKQVLGIGLAYQFKNR